MIGIDIVKISRIEKIYNKFGINFLKKIFTENEIKDIEKYSNFKRKIEKIAGKFAAKEAIFKASKKSFSFKDIEIISDISGAPFCIVKNFHIDISISHDTDYVVAVAHLKTN